MGMVGKNYMPNYMPNDTKMNGRLFSVYFSIKTNGKLPDGLSNRTLYRYTKILKSASIIKKISFGVWAINDHQKAADYEQKYYSKLYAKTTELPHPLTPRQVNKIDKRGHRMVQVITTPKLDLQRLKSHFNYKQRGYAKMVDGGDAGKYLQLWHGGVLFQLYENKIVVRANKSWCAEHHVTTQNDALAELGLIVETFEKNMPCSIRLGKELRIRHSGEYEKMSSDYAKWCKDRGIIITFTLGDFRYWQDFSNGTANEEGNDAEIMDVLDSVANIEVMKTAGEYARLTGGRNILLDLAKQVNDFIPAPLNIKDIKKKHKDLPSYFG